MILFDTNILVHATTRVSLHHMGAKTLCQQAYEGVFNACVAVQNLCEWYGVVTNPRRVTHPLSLGQAVRELEVYLAPSPLRVIAPSPAAWQRLPALLRRAAARGAHAFDVLLVATMLERGVKTFYTENPSDFSAFREVRAVNPFLPA